MSFKLIDKDVDHLELEKKIYKTWQDKDLFRANPFNDKEKFSIMMPPPNVTGTLHIGHALNMTIQDILARYWRMNNKDVLWQPGTDHAGIATQKIVESNLKKKNINKNKLGKSKFLQEVWDWKENSGRQIINQIKRLGASPDWSRERFTLDEDMSNAVRHVFIDLFNKGLIYKEKRLINWDINLQTAVSDLEVEQIEKKGEFVYLKYYNESKSEYIEVATTRPETLFGDQCLSVNPKDRRYANLIGSKVYIPLTNILIPIIADKYVDMKKGSGVLKITPAHDFNDYKIGVKNNLVMKVIFDKFGKFNKNVPYNYQGKDRLKARFEIIEELKEKGFIKKIKKINHTIPIGDRSGTIIEPYLTDQWFLNVKSIATEVVKKVKNGETKFFPSSWTKTFFTWMNEIEPWCISRQIWWGHRIPAWYDQEGNIYVAENEKEALKLAKKKNKKNKIKLRQETDVLDTWFSSALWPFVTLGWPLKTKELKNFYPTSILVTGFDIIFFWVARMMMMGSYFKKSTPFKKVYVHALVRDEKGQKMSKSKGNVIDPLELIQNYGADSLRFTLISMASPGRDVKLSKDRVVGNRNFITKIWSANNFLKLNKCFLKKKINLNNIKLPVNKWIFNEFVKTQNLVSKHLENFRFDEASRHVYKFVWHSYCDWYIEFLKPIFISNNTSEIQEARNFSAFMMANLLKMLHPFIPFFSETVWKKNKLNVIYNSNLISAYWPEYRSKTAYNINQKDINILKELISNIRSTKAELNIKPKLFCDIIFLEKSKKLKTLINQNVKLIKQVGRVNNIINKTDAKKNIIEILVLNEKIELKFDENIDILSQKNKILKKLENIEVQKKKLNGKLQNNAYLKNAPKEVVENDKALLKDLIIEDEKLRSIVSSID